MARPDIPFPSECTFEFVGRWLARFVTIASQADAVVAYARWLVSAGAAAARRWPSEDLAAITDRVCGRSPARVRSPADTFEPLLDALRSWLWTQSDGARDDDGCSPSANAEREALDRALAAHIRAVVGERLVQDPSP